MEYPHTFIGFILPCLRVINSEIIEIALCIFNFCISGINSGAVPGNKSEYPNKICASVASTLYRHINTPLPANYFFSLTVMFLLSASTS